MQSARFRDVDLISISPSEFLERCAAQEAPSPDTRSTLFHYYTCALADMDPNKTSALWTASTTLIDIIRDGGRQLHDEACAHPSIWIGGAWTCTQAHYDGDVPLDLAITMRFPLT